MKKIILLFSCCVVLGACGSGCFLSDCDETETYTYRINNESGTAVLITVGDLQEEVMDNENFECSYSETNNSGFCQSNLEIRIVGTSLGYRCDNNIQNSEDELCFIDETMVFSISEQGGIFQEVGTRVYQYTLTTDLMEGAFELPE